MKVSINWLKELIDFNLTPRQLADQLSLKSIGVKQVTDDFLELDLTYNRGDLLSLRGVAREVAAITNSPTTFDNIPPNWEGKNIAKTPVYIEDSALSPVQIVAKIENLKFGQSNDSWIKKLSSSGVRTVNNIADVTNLVMMEFGQPLHAFDAQTVKNETINVKAAKNGEQITTLDGKIRKLDSTDIVLADSEKPLDVAGVMGGKDTEIKESTQTILLSGSMFNPIHVRNTSKKLGLYSEASKRFQHGLTRTNLIQALSAAIKMYEQMGGKLTAITLVGDLEDEPKILQLTQKKTNSLLGIEIPSEQIEFSLQSLGFKLTPQPSHLESGSLNWEVTVPFWRLDINIEEDLIEEVARMYGYEKIEGVGLIEEKIPSLDQNLPKFISDLKVKLANLGLTEVQSYSFYSTAVLEALGLGKDDTSALIKIANPISSETEYMRMDLWPNLVEVIGRNIRQGFKDIAIFEIGKVYSKDEKKPSENYRLSIALMNGTDNPIAELSSLMQKLQKLKGTNLDPSYFHPNRIKNGMGEIHLRLLNELGIEKRVAVMEIDL